MRGQSEREQKRELRSQMAVETVASERHPERNEDAYFVDPVSEAGGVFDGVSQPRGGEIAARLARNAAEKVLRRVGPEASFEEAHAAVKESLLAADAAIMAHKDAHPEIAPAVSTTGSIVKIWRGEIGDRAFIGNVGDSRVYVQHADGRLECLTLDDAAFLHQEAMLEGRLDTQKAMALQHKLDMVLDPDHAQLSDREKQVFEKRNVLSSALGVNFHKPNTVVYRIQPGDRFIITSDGIHDNLTPDEMAACLNETKHNARGAGELLVKAATSRSKEKIKRAKKDDMTVVVLDPFADRAAAAEGASPPVFQRETPAVRQGEVAYIFVEDRIEGGWKVTGFDGATGEAIVQKGTALRRVSPEEIMSLNRPEEWRRRIQDVRSFAELWQALEAMPGLRGSTQFFTNKELQDVIQQARQSPVLLNLVTSASGLRQKVAELIRMEQISEQFKAA